MNFTKSGSRKHRGTYRSVLFEVIRPRLHRVHFVDNEDDRGAGVPKGFQSSVQEVNFRAPVTVLRLNEHDKQIRGIHNSVFIQSQNNHQVDIRVVGRCSKSTVGKHSLLSCSDVKIVIIASQPLGEAEPGVKVVTQFYVD